MAKDERPPGEREEWVTPRWMGRYEVYIAHTGGNTVAVLVNDPASGPANETSATDRRAVQSQVALLERLYRAGLLGCGCHQPEQLRFASQRDALAGALRALVDLSESDDWCDSGAVADALADARDALAEIAPRARERSLTEEMIDTSR